MIFPINNEHLYEQLFPLETTFFFFPDKRLIAATG